MTNTLPLLIFVAFLTLATLLATRYGMWGIGLATTITGFALFVILFFTPLGGVIWPDSAVIGAQMGLWRWVIALGLMYLTILTLATTINSETNTLDRLKRGYTIFHGLPWSELGPVFAVLGAAGVLSDYLATTNPPSALIAAAQVAESPLGGFENWVGFIVMAVFVSILVMLVWREA